LAADMSKRILPLVAVVMTLFLLVAMPSVYASTLKVTLDPSTKIADVNSSSTTDLVLTYPAGSALAHFLGNISSSITKSGSFNSSSDGVVTFGSSLEEHDHQIQVQSMNVTYALTAKGNSTAFVLHKQTGITAQVLGAFTVVNGTVKVDMEWKAFAVPGDLTLRLGGTDVDVNLVGSAFGFQLGGQPLALAAVSGLFGGDGLWHTPTLDFTSLNTPLSNWTKGYDPLTNTTTFSKTVNGQSSLNTSASFNGQKYTMTMKSDPSAQVAVQGYAVASGDTLVIQPAPVAMNPVVWLVAGAVVILGAGAILYIRRNRHTLSVPVAPSVPIQ